VEFSYLVVVAAEWALPIVLPLAVCTWMYNGTGGSLLIVVLYHATANP
jgi:hypothetical protein